MSETESGYGTPVVEGYTVEETTGPELAATTLAAAPEGGREVQLVLRGSGFQARAMPLIIRIGDLRVDRYAIAPDGRSVTCFLDRLPADGAEISVSYGPGKTAVLPEPFSRDRLPPNRPPSDDPR